MRACNDMREEGGDRRRKGGREGVGGAIEDPGAQAVLWALYLLALNAFCAAESKSCSYSKMDLTEDATHVSGEQSKMARDGQHVPKISSAWPVDNANGGNGGGGGGHQGNDATHARAAEKPKPEGANKEETDKK